MHGDLVRLFVSVRCMSISARMRIIYYYYYYYYNYKYINM